MFPGPTGVWSVTVSILWTPINPLIVSPVQAARQQQQQQRLFGGFRSPQSCAEAGAAEPRRWGRRSGRSLSPPTGVLCLRGRTCLKLGKSERRRAADLPRGSGETGAKDEAPSAAPTRTVFSGKGEGLRAGDEFADGFRTEDPHWQVANLERQKLPRRLQLPSYRSNFFAFSPLFFLIFKRV